jgi:hypothetical protein
MFFIALLKKAKWIIAVLTVVFFVSFAAGYIGGKLRLADVRQIRMSKAYDYYRNLESKIPVYGALLQEYRIWERGKINGFVRQGRIVRGMFLIFFNNWVAAGLTTAVRSVFLLPMFLYPLGRFFQGLTFAQTPVTYSQWGTFISELGGYFLIICAALCAVFWTLSPKSFGFASRKEAFLNSLGFFGLLYFISGIFIFFSSYLETMTLVMRRLG